MTIKNKLRAGFGFLFLLAMLGCSLSIYFLNRLAADARNILKDNYKSVQYAHNIAAAINNGGNLPAPAKDKLIRENMAYQARNVTEQGEKALTDSLIQGYNKLMAAGGNKAQAAALNQVLLRRAYDIMQLNMAAINRKDTTAALTAKKAAILVAFTGAFLFLVAFSFTVNFPGYIANPIKELTGKIKEIANRNYRQQLNFKKDDEFGELANAFNHMAGKLDEYENSSLASLMFEKQRIETIINAMPDGIIGFDAGNNIIFTNEVARGLLKLAEQDEAGIKTSGLSLGNAMLQDILADNNRKVIIHAAGRDGYYSKEVLTVTSGSEAIGSVLILKNITEFHQLDEAKTNFIATISHELKTPIASIKMSLKLLEDSRVGDVNAEQRQLLDNIEQDARRLLQITGELLDTAQAETGKLRLNLGSTPAASIVSYAMKALQTTAAQKLVAVKVMLEDHLPPVYADPDKTTWVLINLLSNAIKYSHNGSAVELSVKQVRAGEIEFSVRDYGSGIQELYLTRIFERYFKVPGKAGGQTGTGLGLAIAKDFIEAQGGHIGVESETGRGSRFYFTLKPAA